MKRTAEGSDKRWSRDQWDQWDKAYGTGTSGHDGQWDHTGIYTCRVYTRCPIPVPSDVES